MQKILAKLWYQKNYLSYLLLPFSWLYQIIISIRKFLYKKNILKTTNFSVPIIVVGNLTVGGTGKTPLVIWLAEFLQQQGLKPGIVSRGYGGKAQRYPQLVNTQSNASEVGDEALLLARRTQYPVVVDPNRVNAVETLLKKYSCDVVISDDGLQHYALGRALEIVVVDGERRFGNGFCLPAGPLREPITRLKTIDCVIVNGGNANDQFSMQLIAEKFYRVNNPAVQKSLEDFKNQTVHAVAGIGNPQRFFQSLRQLGLQIIEHEFPDHYSYDANSFSFADGKPIIMTEKDAVKCAAFADDNFWCLPVGAQLPQNFVAALQKKIIY